MIFLHYPKCSTCKKAKAWLTAHEITVTERDITAENPSAEELREWQKRSGLPLRRFFNTSGMRYRELNLAAKLPEMSEEEQLCLLASDGMLVKRPLLVAENTVLVGFREAEWSKQLKSD